MSKPVRQLSLQQPPKRSVSHQNDKLYHRRQKSADENHRSTSILYHSISDQKKLKKNLSHDRPKVRMAWTSEDPVVEVVASRIGTSSNNKSRGNNNPINNNNTSSGNSSVIGSDKATILYSRQELAERLRLAWKQREANKSNIDIFLAHETTFDDTLDSRCESRLSTASDSPHNLDSKKDVNISPSPLISPPPPLLLSSNNNNNNNNNHNHNHNHNNNINSNNNNNNNNNNKQYEDNFTKPIIDAKAKRASFQSGTNAAFNGIQNKHSFGSPIIKDSIGKRTNSAPPLQRRIPPVNLINASSLKSKVNIVIDTPKISKNKESKRDLTNLTNKLNVSCDDLTLKTPQIFVNSGIFNEKFKSNLTKKRSRNGKRRQDEIFKKTEVSKTNPDVVTMVSLVSDADSDSDIDQNSPRDDKLVSQLRSNLSTTTSIIKSCSPLMMSSGNLTVNSTSRDIYPMPRRILKSVSFQPDSIEKDPTIQSKSKNDDKKGLFFNEKLSKIIFKNCQIENELTVDGIENGKDNWKELDNNGNISSRNYWKSDRLDVNEDDDECPILTDRDKRCLVVPIDDSNDKKRKLLLQRRVKSDENQQNIQMESKISSSTASSERQMTERPSSTLISPYSSSIHQTSTSKLLLKDNFHLESLDSENIDIDVHQEPYLKTTKEKECWHLYRRMCDKGVCVSFDTVLRGMLTPTEYRQRSREVI